MSCMRDRVPERDIPPCLPSCFATQNPSQSLLSLQYSSLMCTVDLQMCIKGKQGHCLFPSRTPETLGLVILLPRLGGREKKNENKAAVPWFVTAHINLETRSRNVFSGDGACGKARFLLVAFSNNPRRWEIGTSVTSCRGEEVFLELRFFFLQKKKQENQRIILPFFCFFF